MCRRWFNSFPSHHFLPLSWRVSIQTVSSHHHQTMIMGLNQRRRWVLDVKLVVMLGLGLLLAMAQHTVQLRSNHPMHGIVDRVNEIGGPYIGLVMAYPPEESALITSRLFVHNSRIPFIDLAGRRFNVGKIKNVDVIYVMTGEQTVNAGITVQILLDAFDIRGVVHYGTAGSSNNSLSFGDVSVMKNVAFTGSWKWKAFKSETGQLPELDFGAFNFPVRGKNLLAKVEFTPSQLYSAGKPMEELFWLPVDSEWFDIATQLQDLELRRCLNDTYCLPETPKVIVGLRGSTADIFLDNAAYREFLFKQFNVSTVDEESAAIVMACLSNAVPSIVFRGVSDLGGGSDRLLSISRISLASVNALRVAAEFIALIDKNNLVHDQ
ncbi:bark storage protein A [Citrus clementina]|nr:bark storage protein A [Citrus x clementina]